MPSATAARGRRLTAPIAALALAFLALPGAALADSNPAIGLRPGDADDPDYAAKAAEAAPDAVHMELPWEDAQPRASAPDWTILDNNFGLYRDEGVDIGSVRVVVAPNWAVAGGRCANEFLMCPPSRAHYGDFKRFIIKAVERYGPGTEYDIERWILWNEPDEGKKWGGEDVADRSYEDYSDLLARFHDAVVQANPDAKVDAGEVRGGTAEPGEWVKRFARFNTQEGRNGNYEALTFHGYSPDAASIVEKIKAHGRLPGVQRVSVSEFAWAVGEPNPDAPGGSFKCVANEGQQKQKFVETVEQVRDNTSGVGRLVWLSVIDRNDRGDKEIRCFDPWYDGDVREGINPYGLYKRSPDGEAPYIARQIVEPFTRFADAGGVGG
jgi:hypothetical protein